FIVSVCRIKSASFTMGSHPCVGFSSLIGAIFLLVFLDDSFGKNFVIVFQLDMKVGFIKCFKRRNSSKGWMVRIFPNGLDGIPGMTPKLTSHQLDNLWVFTETVGGTVNGQKSLP